VNFLTQATIFQIRRVSSISPRALDSSDDRVWPCEPAELYPIAPESGEEAEVRDGRIRIGRYGGTVTAEGTASYIVAANSLTRARLQMGQCATGTLHFGQERFAVEVKVDTAEPSDPFIELTH
jgi:hypothetical protein